MDLNGGFWVETVKLVPSLAVVCFVFSLVTHRMLKAIQTLAEMFRATSQDFLAAMNARNAKEQAVAQEHEKTARERDLVLKELGNTCHAFQERLSNTNEKTVDKVALALDRNSTALGRNTVVLEQVEATLEDIDRQLPAIRSRNDRQKTETLKPGSQG